MKTPIYTAKAIRDWERRWFNEGNSSFGLMKQASLAMALQITDFMDKNHIAQADIVVWCGTGNNGGDGYLTAKYLSHHLSNDGFHVQIIAPDLPRSLDCTRAKSECTDIYICDNVTKIKRHFEKIIHIDALFGNGLDRNLDKHAWHIIDQFNAQSGTKIAIDLPSGLHPDTGTPLPVCTKVDLTLCVMGLKIGLFTGVAKEFVGQVINLPLIPPDDGLSAVAYLPDKPVPKPRKLTAHKGDFGTVVVVGGHERMGGAVIMASEMAMSMGAGRVTAVCHAKHHTAMLARSPNVMVADIEYDVDLGAFDRVAFGMGLGRDDWAEAVYKKMMSVVLAHAFDRVVLDADALYFLAKNPVKLPSHVICTPHSAESARLLGVSVADVDRDKLTALHNLHAKYGGGWVIKGANTLSFDGKTVCVCPFGNPMMATAGMGDVLAGMMVGLDADVHEVVAWHGVLGDELAGRSVFGINAHDMAGVAKAMME
ncbi:MAG: NAD(P)H-hydrate dehydratase [Moraxella sp.]|uniref:NAD(P)H-hydrate dehydratase n=1 Tax=Moraxella sp. TaxID=479 RepID=UPI0026DC6392|nr:NAD(P)H-hydrate dehydratase [Moraxella sp.]MDO4450253.1 NAD(P)H-hydrate dehydratase [Moraxella sp.]